MAKPTPAENNQFVWMADVKEKLEAGRSDYNAVWRHSSLGHLTPIEFVIRRQGERIAEAA